MLSLSCPALTGLGLWGELPSQVSSATSQAPWLPNIYVPCRGIEAAQRCSPSAARVGRGYPSGAGLQAGSSRVVQRGVCVCVSGQGGHGGGATWVCPAHRAAHPCPVLLGPAGSPEAPQEKAEAPAAPARAWSLGLVQQGGQDKGTPPLFLPCPITPVSFSIETTNSSDIFQPLWRCQYSSGESLHVIDRAQTLMSKPLCPCPHPAPPVFHTNAPPLVFSFHVFFGLSLIPEWIFPFIFPPFISSSSLSPFFIISFQSSVFFLLL